MLFYLDTFGTCFYIIIDKLILRLVDEGDTVSALKKLLIQKKWWFTVKPKVGTRRAHRSRTPQSQGPETAKEMVPNPGSEGEDEEVAIGKFGAGEAQCSR